ncbi:MAG: hypothetical protein R3C29_12695 [Dehalococcoidia bacterium]|nr:hypothetical protein [Dehalococcoidia bacterium]MCA9825748.1 hypothetical protein [Dehalococcoidia bacterium]MCA9843053.1 hypothetical protein [Dehalococcoidia bacterium]
MSGIFYDGTHRRVVRVVGTPDPGWRLVTHDLTPAVNECRRILREWMESEDLFLVDWSALAQPYHERRSA